MWCDTRSEHGADHTQKYSASYLLPIPFAIYAVCTDANARTHAPAVWFLVADVELRVQYCRPVQFRHPGLYSAKWLMAGTLKAGML